MRTKLIPALALFAFVVSNAPVEISLNLGAINGSGEKQTTQYHGNLHQLADELEMPIEALQTGLVIPLNSDIHLARILGNRNDLDERYLVNAVEEVVGITHLSISLIKIESYSIRIIKNDRPNFTVQEEKSGCFYRIHSADNLLTDFDYNVSKAKGGQIRQIAEMGFHPFHPLMYNGKQVEVPLTEETLGILNSEAKNITSDPEEREVVLKRIWEKMEKAGIEPVEIQSTTNLIQPLGLTI